MTSTTQTKSKKSNFPSVESALYFVEDVMTRAVTPFFLLGEVSYSVFHNLDREVNAPLEVGLLRKHYTEFAQRTFPMFLPPDTVYEKNKITFTHQGTPVTIKIIDKKFSFLENTRHVFYRLATFFVPNPFDKYWKIKQFV